MFCQWNWETSYIFYFQYQPQVSPNITYVRCKSGVTFIQSGFPDVKISMLLYILYPQQSKYALLFAGGIYMYMS